MRRMSKFSFIFVIKTLTLLCATLVYCAGIKKLINHNVTFWVDKINFFSFILDNQKNGLGHKIRDEKSQAAILSQHSHSHINAKRNRGDYNVNSNAFLKQTPFVILWFYLFLEKTRVPWELQHESAQYRMFRDGRRMHSMWTGRKM